MGTCWEQLPPVWGLGQGRRKLEQGKAGQVQGWRQTGAELGRARDRSRQG